MKNSEDEDMVEKKYGKQIRYKNSLADKGLRDIRIIVPKRAEKSVREWAAEERAALKKELEMELEVGLEDEA